MRVKLQNNPAGMYDVPAAGATTLSSERFRSAGIVLVSAKVILESRILTTFHIVQKSVTLV